MVPERGTAQTSRAPHASARATAPRAPASGAPTADQAMAQIGRLVATIKAERHDDRVVQPIAETGEQEQLGWEETLLQMTADLAAAQATAQAAQRRHEEDASRHQRDLADLELL